MFYLGIETVIWCSLKTFVETETTQKGIVFFALFTSSGSFIILLLKTNRILFQLNETHLFW